MKKIEDEDFVIDADIFPDGVVPVGGIVVVEALNDEGVSTRGYQLLGNMEVDSAIGLLEMGKLMVWEDLQASEDEDDDLEDA